MVKNFQIIIICILFILTSYGNCIALEQIKLRFKSVDVKLEPQKKSNQIYSKKLTNFLKRIISNKEKSEEYKLVVFVRGYNVIVRKHSTKKDLIDFFSENEGRNFIHEVDVYVEMVNNSNNRVEYININILVEEETESYVSIGVRKKINNKIYKKIEFELRKEIKRKFSQKFGDFIIP